MNPEEPMNINERRKYLHKMQRLYRQAPRKERSRLLDQIEKVTGLHRKSLTRLMNSDLRRKSRSRQRGPTYTQETRHVIRASFALFHGSAYTYRKAMNNSMRSDNPNQCALFQFEYQ